MPADVSPGFTLHLSFLFGPLGDRKRLVPRVAWSGCRIGVVGRSQVFGILPNPRQLDNRLIHLFRLALTCVGEFVLEPSGTGSILVVWMPQASVYPPLFRGWVRDRVRVIVKRASVRQNVDSSHTRALESSAVIQHL